MALNSDIREPAVAGMFYPSGRAVLVEEIDQHLNRVSLSLPLGTPVALISPHAGYMYSGLTAAHGFKLLHGKEYDTIVIVSPSHREYFEGVSVYNGHAYRTPLGDLEIDQELREQLVMTDPTIGQSKRGHQQEHAIEVQLPFLQKTLETFKILPIVMGDQRREFCTRLGNALATILKGKNILLIASTDLSHYHSYNEANKLDRILIDDIAALNYDKMMGDLETKRAEACGGGPMVAVMLAAHGMGANIVRVLHHCNSGDITGDHDRVVGYLSAAIFRTN